MDEAEAPPLRPADLARLLLASGDHLPRSRARDQQADLLGLELKRRMLDRLAALDPEPEDLEGTLAAILAENGPPFGPPRGVAGSILDDWHAARASPEFVTWLLERAVTGGEGRQERRRRRDRTEEPPGEGASAPPGGAGGAGGAGRPPGRRCELR